MAAKYCVIEGVEACGKGIASKTIVKSFESSGIPLLHTREPGGSSYGEAIREVLISKKYKTSSMTELLGFYSGRVDHTQNLIIPALEAGQHVLSERYWFSSEVYQQKRSEFEAVHGICAPYLREPDMVILLDISAETSIKRMRERSSREGVPLDKFESKGIDYLQRVRDGYLAIAKRYEDTETPWCVIDAEQPIEVVQAQVLKVMQELVAKP